MNINDNIGTVSIINFFLMLLLFFIVLSGFSALISNFTNKDEYSQY